MEIKKESSAVRVVWSLYQCVSEIRKVACVHELACSSFTNYNFGEVVDHKIGKLILQLHSKNANLCEEI